MTVPRSAHAQVPDESRTPPAAVPVTRAPDTLRLVYLGTRGADDPAARGARLGADEAARTGRLFGRTVTMGIVSAADTALLAAAAERAVASGVAAIVSPCDEIALCLRLAAVAGQRGAIVVNTAADDDALRGASCSASLFHVAPSAAMRRDAERLGGRAGAVAWLPMLERFGAEQLADRYRAAMGREMDERAWSAWMAVKAVTEASLRARTTEPRAIARWLVRPDAQFDGHKGAPLSFRSWDRQLRQPLYLPPAGPAEGPDGGAFTAPPGGGAPVERLDRLGTTASESACRAVAEGAR